MSKSLSVTDSQFYNEFRHYLTEVLRGPIHVLQDGRPYAVFLDITEFERLVRNDRRAYSSNELPHEWRQALRESEGSQEAANLDDLDGTA